MSTKNSDAIKDLRLIARRRIRQYSGTPQPVPCCLGISLDVTCFECSRCFVSDVCSEITQLKARHVIAVEIDTICTLVCLNLYETLCTTYWSKKSLLELLKSKDMLDGQELHFINALLMTEDAVEWIHDSNPRLYKLKGVV